jgi:hypothetical protein
MAEKAYLAVDMGASSGRHVLGHFDGQKLRLEEVYRFDNGPVEAAGNLHWDLLGLWTQVCQGLRAAGAKTNGKIVSVGVDTWGVDFGLLGKNDELLGNPYHYRDARTNGMMDKAFAIVPREEIFRHTGLQFMQFNTLYQLLAMKLAGSSILDAAETLLLMPNLFHWLLTGEKSNEMTHASTSQCYDPQKAAAQESRRRNGPGRHAGCFAGHARYGQRGDGGARRRTIVGPAFQLVLHQPGHVGFDGHRIAPARSDRPGAQTEFYKRRRRGRNHALTEEHCRALAGAGMPPRVEPIGREFFLGRPKPPGGSSNAASLIRQSRCTGISCTQRYARGHPRPLPQDRPGSARGKRGDLAMRA